MTREEERLFWYGGVLHGINVPKEDALRIYRAREMEFAAYIQQVIFGAYAAEKRLKHVCGATGFGLGPDDECPACKESQC